MAGETIVTLVGNLTGDPELRFTPSGSAVANFTIASTPRTFDRQSNEFKDGETLFMRCSIWREAAENVAESLTKGTRVVVTGRMKSRSYQTKEGENRTVIELEADEIGPSLRYATAKVNRTQRGGGGGGGGYGGGGRRSLAGRSAGPGRPGRRRLVRTRPGARRRPAGRRTPTRGRPVPRPAATPAPTTSRRSEVRDLRDPHQSLPIMNPARRPTAAGHQT